MHLVHWLFIGQDQGKILLLAKIHQPNTLIVEYSRLELILLVVPPLCYSSEVLSSGTSGTSSEEEGEGLLEEEEEERLDMEFALESEVC